MKTTQKCLDYNNGLILPDIDNMCQWSMPK
ncbi:unnamed protein product, partial [Rotaria socialis]